MAGETVVSFSIGGLRDLLVAEGEYLNALRSPVDELREKLTAMEGLLEYAETRRDQRTSEVVDLADKLINSIESYVLQVSSKNIITSFRERRIRQKVCLDIQEITTKITDLVNGLSETIKVGGDSASSSLGLGKAYKVQDLSYLNEDDFVGREKDVENLVNYLIDADQSRIISILGMGGLGKTTLARKVYKDKRVVSHFQGFAFVCVSQQCQAEAILRHILQQLAPEKEEEEIKSMSETAVIEQLHIVHREKSCLVVIDDIWSVDDWTGLSRGFPDEDIVMDSKVIITTRNQDVAEVGLCYAPLGLSEEEGWELFQKKIFPPRREFTDSRVYQRMEELGREMIGWCRGIPLAVLVLRGVLVTKATLHEWERFYERRTREVEHKQLYGEVIEELLFSYNELPYQLRPCFLYLGYFIEDEEIEAEKLYMLWDAEGMLLSKDKKEGETMVDVAERYLGELVGRSMVEAELEEVVNPETARRLKSCRLHDLMRELCLSIVKKEKFLKVNDYHTQEIKNNVLDISCLRDHTTTPRHAFYLSDFNSNLSVQIEQEAAQNVRSLRFVQGKLEILANLKKFKFLRVLDFYAVVEVKKNLMKETIHLKYLSFTNCWIDKLPILSVVHFQYLQSLDLRITSIMTFDVPNVLLRKLKRLKHLFLPKSYEVTPELSRLRLDGMRELETLVNFDSRKCEMKDVIQVANLWRFEGNICISSEDDAKDWKGLIGYMKKVDLDSSRRSSLQISLDGPNMINDLNEQLQGCEGIIREANIDGLRGKLLQIFDFTPLLSILIMQNICLEEDPMPTLEKLQNLKQLTLINVELKGKEMTCSTMGFPKLTYLTISNVKNLEKWRVEEGAMCNLRILNIKRCSKLEMLPDGLKFLAALNYLSIYNMPEEFVKRIKVMGRREEGPDFYKIRHVPQVNTRYSFLP